MGANEEAQHKGCCDTELSTNEQTRQEKTKAVRVLHAEIDKLQASIAKLTEEITELKDRVMSKIKVIIAFFQIAGTFRVTFNIPYPVAYTRFMSSMSGVVDVNMPRIMGLRCVVNYSYMSSVLVQTAGPFIAEVLLGVVVLPMLILGSRNIKVFKKLGNWGVSVRE